MGRDYKTKVFKSGNSVAIRLPKALGLREGDEFNLVPCVGGGFELRPLHPEEFLTLDQLFGCMPGFMAEGRMQSDAPIRDWSEPAADDEAA